MTEPKSQSSLLPVIFGDLAAYLLVTLVGFGSHDTLAWESFPRILATFVPFSVSWFILAPWTGALRAGVMRWREHLLRVAFTAAFSAPFAAVVRGLWLGTAVLPLFVLVMAGVSVLAMLLWRAGLLLWLSRQPL